MIDLEDAFVSEARRQGLTPTSATMTEMAIQFAGSKVNGDFVVTRDGYSVHIRDFVGSFCAAYQSEARADPGDLPEGATLTERMRHEVAKHRSRTLPTDWQAKRSQVTGLTGQMMDQRAAERQRKN